MRSILAKKRRFMGAINYKYQQKLTSILRAINAKKIDLLQQKKQQKVIIWGEKNDLK